MMMCWQKKGRISMDIMRGEEFVRKTLSNPQATLDIAKGYDALVGGVDLTIRPGGLPNP